MKQKIGLLMSLFLVVGLDARYLSIKKESQFEQEINKFQFVVVSFFQSPDKAQEFDKELKKEIQSLQETMKAAADTPPFKKDLREDVGFLVVDVSKNTMQELVEQYNISFDDLPEFLLFKNGKVVARLSADKIVKNGHLCKADLLEFLDDYFGENFDDILEQKAEQAAQDREMQLAKYDAYAASRYPYGGWAPYNAWGPYPNSGYNNFYPYAYGYYGFNYWI